MKQTIIYGGTIRTMDARGQVEAVLVSDGRILAAGNRDEIMREAGRKQQEGAGPPEKISLEGRTMLPAFLDAHSHFSGYAGDMLQADLEQAESFGQVQEILRSYREEHRIPDGQWIRGKGYDHNRFMEKEHPSREILDEALPSNPAVITHQSGHMGVFNTRALERLNVTGETQAPEGGVIGKKDGKPTGYMEENAFLHYLRKVPMASLQDYLEAFREAQRCYAANGITTVQEGMMVEELLPFYRAMAEQEMLYLDVVLYADLRQGERLKRALEPWRKGYRDHIRLGGYKIFLDGSPQSRTAWLRAPYEGAADGYRGYGTMTDEEVKAAVRQAFRDQMQLLAHCNGDAACEQYLRCYGEVRKEFPGQEIRPVMIHAQLLGRDQLEQVKDLGILPSFFVDHIFLWGGIHLKNLGKIRAEHLSPCGSALRHGVRFTFHQDTPVTAPDMLETVWCAVNRKTADGQVLGEEERISVEEALKAVTVNAAWQYGEEQEKGSITPGKSADFVILDRDPCRTDPDEIRKIRVLCTVRAGKIIYERREKTGDQEAKRKE